MNQEGPVMTIVSFRVFTISVHTMYVGVHARARGGGGGGLDTQAQYVHVIKTHS